MRFFIVLLFFLGFVAMDLHAQQDSAKDGTYLWLHENGTTYIKGYFKKGSRSRVWKEYDDQGNLLRKTKYKSGSVRWVYIYRNGKLAETIDRKGRRHKMKDCGC